jgi:hypothetical protein
MTLIQGGISGILAALPMSGFAPQISIPLFDWD